ncbi:MAG: hypothetical protein AMXMBFR83_08490 [Phycisphaerae bacterium]
MHAVRFGVLLLLCTGAAAGQSTRPAATRPAGTQPASAPASQPAARPLDPPLGLTSRAATGDWFGLRPALKDLGIETQFFYNNHFLSVLDGGNTTGGGKNSATIDWFLTFDLGKMGLIEDADVLVQARDGWGYSVNPYAGTTRQLDVNDDADGKQDLYIDQLWYRQYFVDHKLAVQVGYLDFQTIVDRNAFANSEDRQFMNTVLDNNPLVPTAGITTLGAAVYLQPVEWYTLIVGAGNAQGPTHAAPNPWYQPDFDTTFHGHAWFVGYVENAFSFRIPGPRGPLPGNYRFGLFYDPRPRARFLHPGLAPDRQGDEWAFYTSCDQLLIRENNKDEQGLGVFFRYGYRHQEINRFSDFWSAGLSYTGLFPQRDRDVLGLGFGQLVSSDNFGRRINRDAGEETVYELYYSIQVTPWLAISPDLQYVDNPGANDSLSHAIVGGVRVRMSF